MSRATPAGDEREALIALLRSIAQHDGAIEPERAAARILAAGFSRAHGETVARMREYHERELADARAERDALAKKLQAEKYECWNATQCLYEMAQTLGQTFAQSDAAIARADAAEKRCDDMADDRDRYIRESDANHRRAYAAEQRAATLAEALNQIGHGEINATSADDAMRQVVDYARAALAGNAATDGDGWIACSREKNPTSRDECWLAVDGSDQGRVVVTAHCENRDEWYIPTPDGDRHIGDLYWTPVAWRPKPKEIVPAPPAANATGEGKA